MKFELENDEKIIDSWTILFMPEGGGKFNGKLIVTNKNLYYDAKFDVSAFGLIDELLWYKIGSEAYIKIPKTRIKSVESEKSFFEKKIKILLDNYSKYTFNYGILNIDPILNAINIKE